MYRIVIYKKYVVRFNFYTCAYLSLHLFVEAL
eukprot:UN08628